jgi:hypothetical protein
MDRIRTSEDSGTFIIARVKSSDEYWGQGYARGEDVVVIALTTRLSSFSREVPPQQHPMTKRMRRWTNERLLYFGIGLAMSVPA